MTRQPRPEATSRSVTLNHTFDRCDMPASLWQTDAVAHPQRASARRPTSSPRRAAASRVLGAGCASSEPMRSTRPASGLRNGMTARGMLSPSTPRRRPLDRRGRRTDGTRPSRRRSARRRPGSARPRNWIRRSYCSLQKNGTGGVVGRSAGRPPRRSGCDAASAPCSAAFVQCSTRISSSNSGLCQRTMSPAPYTSG